MTPVILRQRILERQREATEHLLERIQEGNKVIDRSDRRVKLEDMGFQRGMLIEVGSEKGSRTPR